MTERLQTSPPAELAAAKERLREAARRRVLPAEAVREESRRITAAVTDLAAFRSAEVAGLYLSLPGEVFTAPLIAACRARGKTVCVPARVPGRDAYAMARLDEDMALVEGPFGVSEPGAPAWIDPAAIGMIMVPGVAFDREGNRLGHGKGYYDRLLADCPARRAGLALSSQLVDGVPCGPRDLPMDLIITAERVWEIRRGRESTDLQKKRNP